MSTSDSSVLDRHDDAGGLDCRFPADARSVTDARHALRAWLGPGRSYDEVLLIATELSSNAVRAGASWFRLRAWWEDAGLVVEVADDGPGFDGPLPSADSRPPLDAERGRGLYLVRALTDRCTIFTDDAGAIVRCLLRPR